MCKKTILMTSIMALGLQCSASASAGTLTLAKVKEMQTEVRSGHFSALAGWNGLTYYLQGVVEGIMALNDATPPGSPKKMFCPPKGTSMSLEEVFILLNKADEAQQNSSVPAVLQQQFVEKWPC